MTTRESMEKNIIAKGISILKATKNELKIISTNGIMITTYFYDDRGELIDWKTEKNV